MTRSESCLRAKPGEIFSRWLSQDTAPPENLGNQLLMLHHRTDRETTTKTDMFSYAPVLRRVRRFDIVIGKQQIAWGEMDGRFIDMINPMDVRESVQLEANDFEYRRLPTWMANATYFFGAHSLQLLYIPNFEQERLPTVGWELSYEF